jgi:tRNA 2-thiouridine synthesizing protein A
MEWRWHPDPRSRDPTGGYGRALPSFSRRASTAMTSELQIPQCDEVLDAVGMAMTCAHLTPTIKKRIKAMESGQILEIIADDPTAHEGIPAWSRLTGNELLATVEDSQGIHFYVRKK